MAVYPGGRYRPLNHFSNVGSKPRVGVVLHVNDSDGPSLYSWISGDNGMSCHWQVAKDGVVEQYIDTDNGSWCQMDGNDSYLSIETQGFPGEPLTAAQVTAIAGIVKWLHATHGIPLTLADTVGARGLGWHGMGGAAWGGHTGCPGTSRKAQRADILALAAPAAVASSNLLEDIMALDRTDPDYKQFVADVAFASARETWVGRSTDVIPVAGDPKNPTWRPSSVLADLLDRVKKIEAKVGAE